MPEQSNDYRVVVFGAGGVGKSSLVLRFVKGTFRESYIPTIEDTYRQVISCNKNICTLQITDTTGSHQFPAMQRLSMSKGHAFILVYSCTSRQSLEELRPIWQVSVDATPVSDTILLLYAPPSEFFFFFFFKQYMSATWSSDIRGRLFGLGQTNIFLAVAVFYFEYLVRTGLVLFEPDRLCLICT